MNRQTAIALATHFRIGHQVVERSTGRVYDHTAPLVVYSSKTVNVLSKTTGKMETTTVYTRKVHEDKQVPSISQAKAYVRSLKVRTVVAERKGDTFIAMVRGELKIKADAEAAA